jgi:hypothetical protein
MSNACIGRVADVRGITELLYEHTWGLFDADNAEYSPDYKGDGVEWRCECGWNHIAEDGSFTEDHSAHVARVLKDTYNITSREFSD